MTVLAELSFDAPAVLLFVVTADDVEFIGVSHIGSASNPIHIDVNHFVDQVLNVDFV